MKFRIFVATIFMAVAGVVVYVLRLPQEDTRQIAKQQKAGKSNFDSQLVDSALS